MALVTPKQRNAHSQRRKRGNTPTKERGKQSGAGQTHKHNNTRDDHREGEERSREAAQDRRREGAQVPEGVLECLNRRPMGVLDHMQMNTSVKKRRALQQRTQRGVEGEFPTQGHRPLLPRDTRRGDTKHYNTPSTTQGNQAATKSNDTRREAPVSTWTRQPRGVVRGGRRGLPQSNQQQEENTENTNKENNNGSVIAW